MHVCRQNSSLRHVLTKGVKFSFPLLKIVFDGKFLFQVQAITILQRIFDMEIATPTQKSSVLDPLEIFQPNFCDHKNYHARNPLA